VAAIRVARSGPPGSRRRAARLAVVLLLATLPACGADDDEPVPVEPAERGPDVPIVIEPDAPIVLGVSVPITGPDAVSGLEDRDAVIVAVERWKAEHGSRIHGHDVEIVVEDDGCTEADIAAAAAQRLVEHATVVAVIGPNCSAGAEAASPIFADAGLVSVSGTATRSDLTSNQPPDGFFLRTVYRNDLEGLLIGLFVSFDLGARQAYLVDDSESYGQDLADSAQEIMERNGVEVARVSVERGTADFRDVVQTIVDDEPAFVGFLGFNPEVALFYRQLRDAGFAGVFGAGDAAATPDFIEAVGELAAGALFAGCLLPLPSDVVEDFRDVRGHPPGASAFTAQQMDATTVLLNAVAATAEPQPDRSLVLEPGALRDNVREAGLLDGISGSFTFDASGDRIPLDGAPLPDVVEAALATQDLSVFVDLGLVPCQVQDGRFVNLLGPGAQPMR
jgi:branched-chain amino acid transport system substrate-binding protein